MTTEELQRDKDTDRLLTKDDGNNGGSAQAKPSYASMISDSNEDSAVSSPGEAEEMSCFTITAILSTAFSCKYRER